MTHIRIAGNTDGPALLLLTSKGYALSLRYENPATDVYTTVWEAEKDGNGFSATSPVELLGLVALGEGRGENWKTRPGEPDLLKAFQESAAKDRSDA
jgi:hypothetical protein